MLHGCTQDPDSFAFATDMNALADRERIVVLYPAQSRTANPSRCWNWYQTVHQRRDQGEPSLIAAITRVVISAHVLDAGHVYVAGLSAGGAMAAVMGRLYPDLYAAVGVHSGLAYGSARDMPSAFEAMRGASTVSRNRSPEGTDALGPVPTIVFHGDLDPTVHPSNAGQVIRDAASYRGGTEAPQLRPSPPQPGRVDDGRGYTRTVYRTDSDPDVIVLEEWIVHGGGHAWFGGRRGGSFVDPQGPDASAAMVRFFRTHRVGVTR